MSYRTTLAVVVCFLTAVSLATAAPSQKSKSRHKPKKVVAKAEAPLQAKQENQFVTVDEFVKAKRAAGTPVSIEGYAVVGTKSGSDVRLAVVDSVDHVLSASDADKFAKEGAVATIPAAAVAKHAAWAMTEKGVRRFTMYVGTTSALKALHDTVAKIRVTGRCSGRLINVSGLEYADDNGDWKKL